MDIAIKPLSPDLLEDYLYFFDNMVFTEHPDWKKCYCFSFHFTGKPEQWTQNESRKAVIEFINEGKLTGYLAFSNGKPVGWCNVNDRSNYQRLMQDPDFAKENNGKVCSIVCFLISPDFRRKGIAEKLLQQVCADYALKNYDCIEAYPRKGKLSCEGHFPGPLNLYKKYDFKIENELEYEYVVRKRLS
jgi:ribosomal protein S18 acetylase RimI-like enzyme